MTYAVIPAAGQPRTAAHTVGNTRLLARVLFDPPGGRLGAALIGRALALGDLVMMREQLLTLKLLAERDLARRDLARRGATAPSR